MSIVKDPGSQINEIPNEEIHYCECHDLGLSIGQLGCKWHGPTKVIATQKWRNNWAPENEPKEAWFCDRCCIGFEDYRVPGKYTRIA